MFCSCLAVLHWTKFEMNSLFDRNVTNKTKTICLSPIAACSICACGPKMPLAWPVKLVMKRNNFRYIFFSLSRFSICLNSIIRMSTDVPSVSKCNNISNSLIQFLPMNANDDGFFLRFFLFLVKLKGIRCHLHCFHEIQSRKYEKAKNTYHEFHMVEMNGLKFTKLLWTKHAVLSKLDGELFTREKTNDNNRFTENVCIFPWKFALKTERTTILMSKFMETEPTMSNLWLSSVRRMFQMEKDYTVIHIHNRKSISNFEYDGTMLV